MPCSATSSSTPWRKPHLWSTRDYKKGGTWTGAIEQLDKLRLVPIYVRSDGDGGKGLDALRERGALRGRIRGIRNLWTIA